MNETIVYRHICGYPLEKSSELTRCPGCGGRITPWTVTVAGQTFPTEADAYMPLRVLMRWLVDVDPNLATLLSERLTAEMETMQASDRVSRTETERLVLRQTAKALQDARSGASGS